MTLFQVGLHVRKATAASIPTARMRGGERTLQLAQTDQTALAALGTQAHVHLNGALPGVGADLDAFCLQEAHALSVQASIAAPPLTALGRAEASRCETAIATPKCGNCAGRAKTGNGICNGTLIDNVTIADGATCLNEIVEAMAFAKSLGEDLIKNTLGHTVTLDLALHTKFNAGVEIVSGACDHVDGATAADVIAFYLPEHGFIFEELAKAPYVFAHEIICHASQDLEGYAGAPRPKGGTFCPWSEGWMDCVAAEAIANSLLAGAPPAPLWINEEAIGCIDLTDVAHKARTPRYASPLIMYASLQQQARRGWRGFIRAGVAAGLSAEDAEDLRRQVSVLYNWQCRPPAERAQVGVKLSARASNPMPAAGQNLISICQAFVASQNTANFVNNL